MKHEFDCYTAADVPAGADAGKSEWCREGLSILLVEDPAESAEGMAELLRMRGHEVLVAPNGLVALQAALRRLPDVVLLDIGLPGMDGYGVANWLGAQQCDKRPLLIAVTGLGEELERRQSAEVGIDLHLVKPVDLKWLLNLLKRFLTVIR